MADRSARRAARRSARRSQTRLSTRQLKALVEDAIVDAYDESEQRMGFHAVLDEHLAIPFATTVLGVPVDVSG